MKKRITKFFSVFPSILILLSVIPMTAGALSGDLCHSASTPLSDSFTELTAGDYYLNDDIDLTSRFYVDGDVTLCLNGKTLTAVNSRCAYVSGSGKLTICDCDGSGVFMSNNTDADSSDIYQCIDLAGSGSFTLLGGTVYSDSGYAIACSTGGDVQIEGGTVKGRLAGIDVYKVNNVSIISGEIISETYHAISFDNARPRPLPCVPISSMSDDLKKRSNTYGRSKVEKPVFANILNCCLKVADGQALLKVSDLFQAQRRTPASITD